jgi:subtilisin
MTKASPARSFTVLLVLVVVGVFAQRPLFGQSPRNGRPQIPGEALARTRARGTARVIVGLDLTWMPEQLLPPGRILGQRASIARAQSSVLARLAGVNRASIRQFTYIPFVAMEVNETQLQLLTASPDVRSIESDAVYAPTLAESTPLIGATRAWTTGYAGSGWAVAVLDTGVDSAHPFLAGKVISEACYSTTVAGQSDSLCPGGAASTTAPGSGRPCALSNCSHGTHVAGIAVGHGASFSGVARDASLIAIQVFSSFSTSECGSPPCVLSYASDQILGLEHVYALRSTYNIAAVNLSLGSRDVFTSPCDSDATKAIIDQLRAADIATVIASGNDSSTVGLSAPACISTAISVASTTDGTSGPADRVSAFSNTNQFLSLFAPGETILSSVPGGGFTNFNGTSMAAPHVAGAWAIMKSRRPSATISEIMEAFVATGTPILDPGNGISKPRINVDLALQRLPGGCSYTVTPSRIVAAAFSGTAAIAVNTAANCGWTATSLSPFVSVTSGQTGFGPGNVVLAYSPNPGLSSRDGFVSIADLTVAIAQQGRRTSPDVNLDGRADILWQHATEGWLATWYLDGWTVLGTDFLSIPRVADLHWQIVGTGDLDGDGHLDLVWRHETEGWVAVWFLNEHSVIGTQFLSIDRVPDANWRIRAVGDIDGDGKADLIWQHTTEGLLAVWLMNGTQVTTTRLLSIDHASDLQWQIVGAGDLNGDGKADLLWQHQAQGWVAVWYLDSSQVVGTEFLSIPRVDDTNWHIRGVGDADGDGYPDLFWQHDLTGGLAVWLMHGSSVIVPRLLSIDHVDDLHWRVVGPG